MEENLPEDIQRMLTIIDEQTSRGEKILVDLLSFAKPTHPQKELCNINEVLNKVIELDKKWMEMEKIEI